MPSSSVFEPFWVSEQDALTIHVMQIARHGGLDGIRDKGLLQSALARPKHVFFYTPNVNLTDLAAAYGYGIAKNHPFLDGNKRTAYVVTRLFLKLNGFDMTASADDKYLAMIALAEGQWGEEEFARWLKKAAQPMG